MKQQYHQKQLQLQQQRQRLISETANSTADSSDESSKRQPIPLHIALQNHLHAHHVTEGNVSDLAQALQDWDTRDRNVNLPATQVKVCILALCVYPFLRQTYRSPTIVMLMQPMPAFNLNSKHDDELDQTSLPLEELSLNDVPHSRSLADSLATLIQGMDSKSSSFDPSLGACHYCSPSHWFV